MHKGTTPLQLQKHKLRENKVTLYENKFEFSNDVITEGFSVSNVSLRTGR